MNYFNNELSQGLSNFNFDSPTPTFANTPQGQQGLYNHLYGTSTDGSSLVQQQPTSSGFGFNTGTLGAVAGGVQALSGLANAFMGYKNYQMAKDQFGFQKGLANRNLFNQAKTINNTYNNAAQVAAGMVGGRDSSGKYGLTDQSIVDKYAASAREKHVDGSPIK